MRFRLFAMGFIAAITCHGQTPGQALESLRDLRWDHRVIVAHLPRGFEAAAETLAAAQAGIAERHLVWLLTDDSSRRTNARRPVSPALWNRLRERFFSDGETVVVLIGKDGGVKDRAARLDLEAIFAQIDVMPMRRAEMRRQAAEQ